MDFTYPNCSQFENISFSCYNNQHIGTRLGLYTFFTCSITITIFGNLCIIISISHFTQLYSPTNFLLLSLATTDLCLGLFIMPFSMVRTVENCWHFGNLFCNIHYGLDLSLSFISILHLCMIAIDRFYAVCEPLCYHAKITMLVIKRLIFFSWSIPMVFSLGVIISNSLVSGIEGHILVTCLNVCPIPFNQLWSIVVFSVCFFVPGTVMIGIYVKIFFVSNRHAKLLENKVHDVNEVADTVSRKQERKAAKKLSVLMSVFLTCWLPLFIIILINPFINFSVPKTMFEVFNWFSYINSTFNPILYGFLYPWFRKALKHIICGQICNPLSHTNLFSDE